MTTGGGVLDTLFDDNAPLTEQEQKDLLVPAEAKEKRPCPVCGKVLTWVADGSRPRQHKCEPITKHLDGKSQCIHGCGIWVPNTTPGKDVECDACSAQYVGLPPRAATAPLNNLEDYAMSQPVVAVTFDTPPADGPTVDEVVAKYVATRDEIAEKTKALEKELAVLKDYQKKRELWLLGRLDASGVESMRTAHGTCFVDWKDSATVADAETFMTWVREDWDTRKTFLENRVSKTAVKQLLSEDQTLPPGINYTKIKDVKIRRA